MSIHQDTRDIPKINRMRFRYLAFCIVGMVQASSVYLLTQLGSSCSYIADFDPQFECPHNDILEYPGYSFIATPRLYYHQYKKCQDNKKIIIAIEVVCFISEKTEMVLFLTIPETALLLRPYLRSSWFTDLLEFTLHITSVKGRKNSLYMS